MNAPLPESVRKALESVTRFPRWMWRNEVIRDLVRWMRAHNENRPASERLRFVGIDGSTEAGRAAVVGGAGGVGRRAAVGGRPRVLGRLLGARGARPGALGRGAHARRAPPCAVARGLQSDLERVLHRGSHSEHQSE